MFAIGLPLAACGTNATGLPVDADPVTLPPAPTPDSGTRMPPVIVPPDAAAPDLPPPDAGDAAPAIICPATNLQPNPACTFGYHPLKKASPEVVLVFDRSSAMLRTAAGSMQTRWIEMVAAVEENVMRTHGGLSWGLKLFPSTTMCNVTEALDVPVGVGNLNPIVTRIRGNVPPMGPEGSPLDLGLKRAASGLRATASRNPRYLVLATDGLPNCPPGLPGETEAIRSVDSFTREGLRTFVIGTATPTSPQHRALNDLASAGGEGRAGDTKYFPVLNKAQMLQALDEITGRLTSCVLTVNALAPTPGSVAMNIGNTRIPRDPSRQNGWHWGGSPNLQVVHVYGPACEMLKANPLATAELVFGCEGHEPPEPPPCSRAAN